MPEFELEGEYKAVAEAQEEEMEGLLATANVQGVGVGHKITNGVDTGDPCVTVYVSQKLDEGLLRPDEKISKRSGKFKTDIVESGLIFAGGTATRTPTTRTRERTRRVETTTPSRTAEPTTNGGATSRVIPYVDVATETETFEEVGVQVLRGRIRPAEGGYSVGHFRITAGTIATSVYDANPFPGVPRRYYILSNNHVLANSNNARIGDPILQPGPFDGGTLPADQIASLSRFVPIDFQPPYGGGSLNLVDAAIAEGDFHDLDREIYWIGYVSGVRNITAIGDIVQKTGRTTNYTTGRVQSINATVNVNYGGGRVARMARQIITSNLSAGGDSGSLLCDMNGNAVGLLFAGSTTITIHNHIRFVQTLLGIRVV